MAEVWDAGEDRWRLVDAQLDAVWRSRIGFRGDPLDVERDSFLVAADAWMHCRAGDEEPARFGISFADLYGLWFVAGNLIRDLAALNKMEMLPWDTWAAHPAPGEPIADDQLAFFDQLAAVTSDPDSHLDELRRLYESHDRLQVPAEVFNALRQRHEAVA